MKKFLELVCYLSLCAILAVRTTANPPFQAERITTPEELPEKPTLIASGYKFIGRVVGSFSGGQTIPFEEERVEWGEHIFREVNADYGDPYGGGTIAGNVLVRGTDRPNGVAVHTSSYAYGMCIAQNIITSTNTTGTQITSSLMYIASGHPFSLNFSQLPRFTRSSSTDGAVSTGATQLEVRVYRIPATPEMYFENPQGFQIVELPPTWREARSWANEDGGHEVVQPSLPSRELSSGFYLVAVIISAGSGAQGRTYYRSTRTTSMVNFEAVLQ